MFINLVEPHSPYDSPGQFCGHFVTDRSIELKENMWREFFLGKKSFTKKEIRHLNELYDGEILYVDYIIGEIIQHLQVEDLWEDTMFVVTSDHGENIGHHEMMDHVFSLHESIIKVPLIIRYPGLFPPGTRYEYPVQLTDIFPTLLEMVGVNVDYPSQGISLLGRNADDHAVIFSEYYFPKQVLNGLKGKGMLDPEQEETPLDRYKRRIRVVIKDDMKLTWGSDGSHELYNLRKDPGERENLIDSQGYDEVLTELQALLDSLVEKYDLKRSKALPVDDRELDDVTRKKLESLGYLQ